VDSNGTLEKRLCSFILRLENNQNGSIEFYGNHQSRLEDWRKLLTGYMSQRGFHQMFTPVKKLKQGTFASVYMVRRNSDGQLFAAKAFSKEGIYSKKHGKVST
jgi:hypothetical protein